MFSQWQALLRYQCCVLCHQRSDEPLCHWCRRDIQRFDLNSCAGNLMLRPDVKAALPKLHNIKITAAAPYQWPLSHFITKLKFGQKSHYAAALAQVFNHSISDYLTPLPEALIPVPLHPKRYRQRKYNQTAEIGRFICHHAGIPLLTQSCRRHIYTQAQTELTGAQRRRNVRDAFSVVKPIQYHHIAIFDDIVTTGSTVRSLIDCLHQQQPGLKIDIWCVCLSLPKPGRT